MLYFNPIRPGRTPLQYMTLVKVGMFSGRQHATLIKKENLIFVIYKEIQKGSFAVIYD
jgi:hypothetical protein